jgi:hypothetical protein
MNSDLALSEIRVADLLQSSPKAVRFFIEQKTACATCLLAKFCTLQDVVRTYQLDEGRFRKELVRYTQPPHEENP